VYQCVHLLHKITSNTLHYPDDSDPKRRVVLRKDEKSRQDMLAHLLKKHNLADLLFGDLEGFKQARRIASF